MYGRELTMGVCMRMRMRVYMCIHKGAEIYLRGNH